MMNGSGNLFGFRGGMAMGMGMGGMRELTEPAFMRRDLPMIQDELDLDDDQSMIVEVLVLDYEAAYAEAAEAARGEFENLRPQTPEEQARRDERRALMDEFRGMRDEMRAFREKMESEDLDEAERAKLRDAMRREDAAATNSESSGSRAE